jgi:hypothetical protein
MVSTGPQRRVACRPVVRQGCHVATAAIVSANTPGASTGTKWPALGTGTTATSEKNASSRSDHVRGKSGSCSGHRNVVGMGTRSAGSGSVSASARVISPLPARYQPIDATNAPGAP